MSYQAKFAGAQFVSRAADIVRQKGISLHVGTDFDEYAEIVREYRPEQPLGPPFDPQIHDLRQSTGFWIVGRNEKSEIVHTQAMRILDLKDHTNGAYD